MERRSFVFKQEYFEAIRSLPKIKRVALYEAICEYSLYGKEVPLSGTARSVFLLVKPMVDKEIRASEEGRRSAEYKEWRKDVFIRDDFTCRDCGERGGRLNAHHIKRYCDFPDLRFDRDNGVTLCERCHRLVHKIEREGEAGCQTE